MTRKEYMNGYGAGRTAEENAALHRAYYAQFVDGRVRSLVLMSIGKDLVVGSTDPHFNDIPLRRWDRLVALLPFSVTDGLKEAGDYLTLATGVCVLKEAAQQISEGTL